MQKIITKYPVLNIILGVVLIALGIVALLQQDILEEGIQYVAAFLILLYTVVRFIKEMKLYKDERAKVILSMELVIVALLVIGLVSIDRLSIVLTLGLVLYLQGASHLLLLQVLKKTVSMGQFVIHLVLLTVGAYLIFGQDQEIEEIIQYIVVGTLLLYGLLFLIMGLKKLMEEKKKKTPKEKVSEKKEPVKAVPTTPEPRTKESQNPNETTTMYTKERLMSKSVEELKQMCKARDIKGYSSLTKDKLVEKLWLYEKENK